MRIKSTKKTSAILNVTFYRNIYHVTLISVIRKDKIFLYLKKSFAYQSFILVFSTSYQILSIFSLYRAKFFPDSSKFKKSPNLITLKINVRP